MEYVGMSKWTQKRQPAHTNDSEQTEDIVGDSNDQYESNNWDEWAEDDVPLHRR
jgi:hypothetical protein